MAQNEEPQLGLGARISQNIQMAKKGYEQLVHAIIRPPRAEYSIEALGPSEFTFLGARFHREDMVLNTKRENKGVNAQEGALLNLHASLWTRQGEEERAQKSIVIYLHGNASARVEVLPQLSFLLSSGVYGVCSLDFCGSGKSDGDYVSLGYYERYDLETLLDFLKQRYGNSLEVILWGRSMGASTALMHASQITRDAINVAANGNAQQPPPDSNNSLIDLLDDQSNASATAPKFNPLKGLICDSPFASLPQLCEELVEKARAQGIVVPGVVVSVAIALIARSVNRMAHFSIHEISPIQHAPTIDTPALFVVGADDDFIPPHHSEDLCSVYRKGVSTNLLMVPGGHNDARPFLVFEAVSQFLQYRLSLHPDMVLPVPDSLMSRLHQYPPWSYANQPQVFVAHKTVANTIDNSAKAQAQSLGMTQDRQDDIQNKLSSMFGQGSRESAQNSSPSHGTTATSNGNSNSTIVQSPSRTVDRTAAAPDSREEEDVVSMGVPVVGVPISLDDFDQGTE